MVVHGSEHVTGKALRRTIYYEFRAAEEILEDGPWDRNWIDRRLRLIPLALRRQRETFPETEPYVWRISDEFRPRPGNDEAEELRVAHVTNMPGSYCSAGDAGKRVLVD
jgi:hypothetical protein